MRIRELETQQSRIPNHHDLAQATSESPPFQYFLEEEDPPNISPSISVTSNPPKTKVIGFVSDIPDVKLTQDQDQPIINPLRASKSQLLFGDHGYFRRCASLSK